LGRRFGDRFPIYKTVLLRELWPPYGLKKSVSTAGGMVKTGMDFETSSVKTLAILSEDARNASIGKLGFARVDGMGVW